MARHCKVHAAWDDELVAAPEPSASLTDTVPSADGEDSVDHWGGEVLRIEREMSLVMLTYNELKAKLAFARGRHRQTVRAREVRTRPILRPEEADELVAASPVAAERLQSALTSPLLARTQSSSEAPPAKRPRTSGRTCCL